MSERRLRISIRLDPVHPQDWDRIPFKRACEDCTHFNDEKKSCTIGYNPEPHLRKNQDDQYLRSGKIALCRFIEID